MGDDRIFSQEDIEACYLKKNAAIVLRTDPFIMMTTKQIVQLVDDHEDLANEHSETVFNLGVYKTRCNLSKRFLSAALSRWQKERERARRMAAYAREWRRKAYDLTEKLHYQGELLDDANTGTMMAIEAIERLGHTSHCARRLAWGDGECECSGRKP